MNAHAEIIATPLSRNAPMRMASLPACDSNADVSDYWMEHCDPENEIGAIATAHFDHFDIHGDLSECDAELVCLEVQEGSNFIHYTRHAAIVFLGFDAVCEIEAQQSEAIQ